MKTFEQHKNRIKTFCETINEDKSLLKDLESIGVNEDTFSIDDISDAFHDAITEDKFADEDWVDVSIEEDYNVDINNHSNSSDIEVKWAGSIDLGNVESDTLIKEVINSLDSNDDDYNQKRYTVDQIREALEYTDWDDHVALEQDEAEAEITNTTSDAGNAEIEYALKEGSYFITAQIDDMWTEFTGHLGHED